jgi:hypothetical protein
VRAIGPSLATSGVPGILANPTLDLFDGSGTLLESNDDWRTKQEAEIIASTVPPTSDLESAIVRTLAPGNYTAIVKGKNQATGLALVEVYDLAPDMGKIGNISTRSQVGTGDNALIGGFILTGPQVKSVIVRAIGPSLNSGPAPISGALADPILEVRNGNGQVLQSNDNYATNPKSGSIYIYHLAPTDTHESVVVLDLVPGNYTAIVRGLNDTTGIGLVEIYGVQ